MFIREHPSGTGCLLEALLLHKNKHKSWTNGNNRKYAISTRTKCKLSGISPGQHTATLETLLRHFLLDVVKYSYIEDHMHTDKSLNTRVHKQFITMELIYFILCLSIAKLDTSLYQRLLTNIVNIKIPLHLSEWMNMRKYLAFAANSRRVPSYMITKSSGLIHVNYRVPPSITTFHFLMYTGKWIRLYLCKCYANTIEVFVEPFYDVNTYVNKYVVNK